jgi:hypothetical protein
MYNLEQEDFHCLNQHPAGAPQVLLVVFGIGFVKMHDKSLVCVVSACMQWWSYISRNWQERLADRN